MTTNKNRKLTIALAAILPLALLSCQDEFFHSVTGQGEIVSQTVSLDDFTGFASTIAADIYVTQGDKQEVVIEAQQNIIDNIDLDRIDHGIWTIHYHEMVRYSKPVKIHITVPTLTFAAISGSGKIEGVTRFDDLDNLKLVISGSGTIDLETYSDAIDAVISGSGDLLLSGKTKKLMLLISGSGGLYAGQLLSPQAEITISGSGSARVNADESLQVLVTGSGNVYYTGNPELDIHVSGSGKVVRQ